MTPLLSVRNLSVSFATPRGVARAVDDVSFDLLPGETLALVGESGCGKTVTALSLLKLIPEPPGRTDPRSRVEYAGTNVLALGGEALRQVRGGQIAMVFQEPTTSLNPVLTVGSQIAETVRAHRETDRAGARERAVGMMRLAGIPEPEERYGSYPHQLSGGLKQRIMIAIALSCEPRILIADEPTTALDVTIQAQIIELLSDLRKRLGLAVLLISHDLGLVAGIADRVAVMYAGRIVEEATTADLFARPRHPYTEGLLQAAPRVDRPQAALAAIPGSVPSATAWPSGCRFHPRCPHAWDRCIREEPGLLQAGATRSSRCWLVVEPERRRPATTAVTGTA
ncbi:MAG: ABC transporter ATP-binding protein [Gemmatimonadetes bacterium]|nr:ABC transporter ATP-binding protein [Gemmatimonadota bacterium]